MQCKTCGREISDTSKFCPYCGSKVEQPCNSAENKTTETAYDSAAGTNAETAYDNTANANAETAYNSAAGTNTETGRASFESNTADSFQTTPADNSEEKRNILQVGFFILAGICFIMVFRSLLSGIQNFSYSSTLQGLGSILNMVCYAGIAASLIMIALSEGKERIKTFFVILSGLAAIIALCGIIEFITSVFRNFKYYFSFDTFLWSLSSLLLTLTIMAAVVGITYAFLYLSGSTPDLSNIAGAFNGSVGGSQTSETTQGSSNAGTNYQNNGTNYGSQAYRTNYEGQNMENNYNNQGTNYNYQGANSNYQGSDPRYSRPGVTPLKTDRGLLGYIVLSILTCGIYSYYFIYSVARDVNTACAGDGKSTGGLLQFILLSILTCGIYSWWWQYSLGNRLAANAPRYGLSFTENGTTILLWLLFGSFLCFIGPFIAMNIIIKNTNSICMAYNRYNGLI